MRTIKHPRDRATLNQITTFKQSYEERVQLIQYCNDRGLNVSKFIRAVINKYIEKHDNNITFEGNVKRDKEFELFITVQEKVKNVLFTLSECQTELDQLLESLENNIQQSDLRQDDQNEYLSCMDESSCGFGYVLDDMQRINDLK